ncbi:MAG: cob(I)yrinic acid a,c-diamide adenosyltransferase [bacterium]
MSRDSSLDDRHKKRMERKKAVVDAGIARANEKKGVVLVLTGNGKGKSSSGFGMVARALGHDMKVGVVQFIKGSYSTGEEAFFRCFPDNVDYHVMGDGFTWETQNRDQDVATAMKAWEQSEAFLRDESKDIVLLDELNIVLNLSYVSTELVVAALAERPAMQHVIITGRGAPEALIEVADTVTEMRDVKHAYRAGIMAQEGIEL